MGRVITLLFYSLYRAPSYEPSNQDYYLWSVRAGNFSPGLKVNDQLVAYATRILAVRLKMYVWSHHRALVRLL